MVTRAGYDMRTRNLRAKLGAVWTCIGELEVWCSPKSQRSVPGDEAQGNGSDGDLVAREMYLQQMALIDRLVHGLLHVLGKLPPEGPSLYCGTVSAQTDSVKANKRRVKLLYRAMEHTIYK